MSQAPHRRLSAEETVALQGLFVEVRSNARSLVGVISTFVVPLEAVMAFVVLWPPFWRPSMAASAISIAAGVAILYALWAHRIYQPVRLLRADMLAGEAEAREGEVGSCEPADYFVAVTLRESPRAVIKLAPPVVGTDDRRDLSVGQRIRMDVLPHSGRLLALTHG
ncbi:MAG: hypothetical protein H7338_17685 [Candidatus Sericytochromatia bacterium]|nr:hypothetical protein [Candidatus Sericytochromatia bacterium]